MIDAWRRLGPRGFARAALHEVGRRTHGPVERAYLRARPVASLPRTLSGRDATVALRGPLLDAMPAVKAFERAPGDIVKRADAVRAHSFDLLGSGPTDLGGQIDWLSDFKSGARWPLVHWSRVPIVLAAGADIKVLWELSRGQHMPLLAAAHAVTGDDGYLEELGAQLRSWIAANPVGYGPNWACTMDVAIRAANWAAALALCAEAAEGRGWRDEAIASLLAHGRFIRGHLEWSVVRGNHYLSDVVGLLPLAALFSDRAWARWAATELEREMPHQVRPDGVAHEASIPYHRLVTELFARGTEAVDALFPGRLPAGYRDQLERMHDFVAAYTRPDGLAPAIGDGDDGRFLPLGDYGADPRSHAHLLGGRRTAAGAFPQGGFFVLRTGKLYAIVRCGDTGLGGLGAHAHNDQLSFELALDSQSLVIDPGTFAYTSDPAARNAFRSTAAHATLRIDGAEQNPLVALFALPDRTRAEALEWSDTHFVGRAGRHERRLELDGVDLRIRDRVLGPGGEELEWAFPLAGGEARAGPGGAEAQLPGARLTITGEGLEFVVAEGEYSPRFGVREPIPYIRARRTSAPGEDVAQLVLRAEPLL